MRNLQRFALNLMGPALGFLLAGEVFVCKKYQFLISWLLVPILVVLTLLGLGHAFTTTGLIFAILIYVGILIYLVVWIVGAVKAAVAWNGSVEERRVRRAQTILLVGYAVVFPVWLLLTIVMNLITEVEGPLPIWWIVSTIVTIGLMVAIPLADKSGGLTRNRKDFFAAALAPVFGILGARSLIQGLWVKGLAFLMAGWISIATWVWIAKWTDLHLASDSMVIALLLALHVVVVVYLGLWLWGITEWIDSGERPGDVG